MEEEVVGAESELSLKPPPRLTASIVGERDLPTGIEIKDCQLDPDCNDLALYLLEIVSTKHPKWEDWHRINRAIGGSTVAALMGHDTCTSPKQALKVHCFLESKKEPSDYGRMAMGHGRYFEPYCMSLLRKWKPGKFDYTAVPMSQLFRLHSKSLQRDLLLTTTPDYYDGSVVLEIKCPYVGSKREDGDAEAFQDFWSTKHPVCGRTSYFLQAAFYTWLARSRDVQRFYVAVMFVVNNERMCVKLWEYQVSESLDCFFAEFFKRLMNTQPDRFVIRKHFREQGDALCRDHFISYETSGLYTPLPGGHVLEEQTEDDTWDDSDCVPRQ